MSASDILMSARAIIEVEAPYFSSGVYGLIYKEDTSIPTMATTSGLVCKYNPAFVEAHSKEEIAAVIVHELTHVISGHFVRFGHLTSLGELLVANIAQDLAINPQLRDAGWKLPPCAIFPVGYNLPEGKTAEEYYALLIKDPPKKKGGGKKGKEGDGKSTPQPGADDGQGKNDADGSNGADGNADETTGQVCSGGCGGVAGKDSEEDKIENARDGRDPVDQEVIMKKMAKDIQDFASTPGRGRLPSFLVEYAKYKLEPPRVNWRNRLASIIRRATGKIVSGGSDFSLRRPSKRSYVRNMVRPGLVQVLPEVVIIRDTSSSMGSKQLQIATSEACAVLRSLGLDTAWFMDADVKVGFCKRVRLQEIPRIPVHGRGGTSFTEPIKRALKLRPRPELLFYFTDGDGDAPPEAPVGVEVIWCVVPSYCNKAPAEWGHTVIIQE